MNNLLPPNATKQEQALEGASSRVGTVQVPVKDLWNPQTCPASLLPWLAWGLSVDEWDSGWPEAVKRQVVADSLELHRYKGTPWAVQRALDMTGFPHAQLQEWFEYDGAPGHFRIVIDLLDQGIDEETFGRLVARIARYKNVRSWLERLDLWLSGRGVLNHALTCQGGEVITVWPFRTTTIEQTGIGFHALGLQAVETITIYPQSHI